jgi:outer membrane protein OmpA-like peptidoglycan-associated protein
MKFLLAFLIITSNLSYAQERFTIHFDFDNYNLSVSEKRRLDSLITSVKTSSTVEKIELTGHTDAIGSNDYNDRLSKRRIASVKTYLITHGIPTGNITSENAFGEKQPVAENINAENRALNRRVEISILNESSPTNNGLTLKEKIADSTTTVGSNILLKNINFYGGMHQFLPESAPALNELLEALKTYPKLVIRIEGHICCQDGPGDGNDLETGLQNLSESRAKAIMDYLIDAGISASRLSYKGFAHTRPIYPYPENNEEERTLNRRVEIKILSK